MQRRGQFLNRAVERSSSDPFSTDSANLTSTTPAHASPAQAAAQSNPHKRRTAHQPPRVPSSEAFGRRPSARLHRSTTGRHPKPFTIPDLPDLTPEWEIRSITHPHGRASASGDLFLHHYLRRRSSRVIRRASIVAGY